MFAKKESVDAKSVRRNSKYATWVHKTKMLKEEIRTSWAKEIRSFHWKEKIYSAYLSFHL